MLVSSSQCLTTPSDRLDLPAPSMHLWPTGCRSLCDLHLLRHMTELRDLDLSQTDISDTGLFRVAAMSQLTRLSLRDTAVTAVAFRALASLGSLQSLDLSHTSIHDRIQHNLGPPGSPLTPVRALAEHADLPASHHSRVIVRSIEVRPAVM